MGWIRFVVVAAAWVSSTAEAASDTALFASEGSVADARGAVSPSRWKVRYDPSLGVGVYSPDFHYPVPTYSLELGARLLPALSLGAEVGGLGAMPYGQTFLRAHVLGHHTWDAYVGVSAGVVGTRTGVQCVVVTPGVQLDGIQLDVGCADSACDGTGGRALASTTAADNRDTSDRRLEHVHSRSLP